MVIVLDRPPLHVAEEEADGIMLPRVEVLLVRRMNVVPTNVLALLHRTVNTIAENPTPVVVRIEEEADPHQIVTTMTDTQTEVIPLQLPLRMKNATTIVEVMTIAMLETVLLVHLHRRVLLLLHHVVENAPVLLLTRCHSKLY